MATHNLEMPCMRLNLEEVQRLCGIERSMCKVALDALVETKFLCVRSDGSYVRLAETSVRLTADSVRLLVRRRRE